jgi:hypothetical protein
VFGLRDRVIAAGIDAGETSDGSPGPNVEMRVDDSDGYVLVIARPRPNQADGKQHA